MTAYLPALAGGILIGVSATLLLMLNGRIAGISGILNGALETVDGDRQWRWLFLLGLLAGAGAWIHWNGADYYAADAYSPGLMTSAGLLVGAGTRLGSGCTSGHGVCGLGRLSPRSLVATATFMIVAIATVFVTRHLLNGWPP
jgi:hypothetical protein